MGTFAISVPIFFKYNVVSSTHRNLSLYRRRSRSGSAGNGFEVAVASVASGKKLFHFSGFASCADVKGLLFREDIFLSYLEATNAYFSSRLASAW